MESTSEARIATESVLIQAYSFKPIKMPAVETDAYVAHRRRFAFEILTTELDFTASLVKSGG